MNSTQQSSRVSQRAAAPSTSQRAGVALIMVLILVVLISLGAYSFVDQMTAQEKATVMMGRSAQANAAVASGVEFLKDHLVLDPTIQFDEGGHWDNPNFRNVVVSTDPLAPTHFSIISVMQDQFGEPTGIRFGLANEGAKINVNTLATSDLYKAQEPAGEDGEEGEAAGNSPEDAFAEDPRRNALMQLPAMTEPIADAILDWIDEDDEPRDFGAESESYSMLGYAPKNGPIQSLDELLLVQGVTTELLYGADRNHNGTLEANEQTTLNGVGGSMTRGWSAYLTISSKDYFQQGTPDLETPIDLNQEDLEALFDAVAEAFDDELATYVVAYRQNGPYTPPAEVPEEDAEPDAGGGGERGQGGQGGPEEPEPPLEPEPLGDRTVSLDTAAKVEFSSLLDLVGTSVLGKFEDEDEPVLVSSPYGEESDLGSVLPAMYRSLTAGESGGDGRVDTNQACSAVLASLPNVDEVVLQGLLTGQDTAGASGDDNYLYPTWPLAQGIVSIEQMKALLPYVSGTGTVFRAQVVGYSDVPGVFARAEVVIDASEELPRVVSWRDMTHLGPGFDLETLMQ